MLTLGLTLALCATPSARLLTESDAPLTNDEIVETRRQLRIVEGHIAELKPRMPTGYVVGMATGFSISILLLPGVPLLIAGISTGTSVLLGFGAVLSTIGGIGLVVALICLVTGNNAESDIADERARLVELRDQLKVRLGTIPPTSPTIPVPPPYVPGVQREVPPRLITVARF
jgi:hypothetical protein